MLFLAPHLKKIPAPGAQKHFRLAGYQIFIIIGWTIWHTGDCDKGRSSGVRIFFLCGNEKRTGGIVIIDFDMDKLIVDVVVNISFTGNLPIAPALSATFCAKVYVCVHVGVRVYVCVCVCRCVCVCVCVCTTIHRCQARKHRRRASHTHTHTHRHCTQLGDETQ